MFYEPMPDCVPELYRSRREDEEHRFDLKMQRQDHYFANRQKIDAAVASGLPILNFGGYDSCQDCLDADHDTTTNENDDTCCVICRNPACPQHRKEASQ